MFQDFVYRVKNRSSGQNYISIWDTFSLYSFDLCCEVIQINKVFVKSKKYCTVNVFIQIKNFFFFSDEFYLFSHKHYEDKDSTNSWGFRQTS